MNDKNIANIIGMRIKVLVKLMKFILSNEVYICIIIN